MCMKGDDLMSADETTKSEKVPEEEMIKINGGQGEPIENIYRCYCDNYKYAMGMVHGSCASCKYLDYWNKKCEYPDPQR